MTPIYEIFSMITQELSKKIAIKIANKSLRQYELKILNKP